MAFCSVYWRAMKKDISLYYITLHIYTKRAFCLQFPPSPKHHFVFTMLYFSPIISKEVVYGISA